MAGVALPAEGDLIVSDDTGDDAAVYRLDGERALVLTVDVITPLTGDAELFGRIAVANALSDVFAMGGSPALALNVCCFPEQAPHEALNLILRGGRAMADEAGCAIVGGHTVRDPELKYGLSVIGFVHPDRVKRNSTARPGDVLILTKPIGSGVLFTGVKKGRIPDEALERACRTMTVLNKAPMEVAHLVDTSAMTDITGFGLGGHLRNMARGAGVGIRIFADRVPAFPEALELIRAGLGTGSTAPNHDSFAPILRLEADVPEERLKLLADPQTSGGLVLAVHPRDAERALALLRARGTPAAVAIGEVFETGGQPVLAVAG